MKEFYHAWNLVFEGFPEYFAKLMRIFPDVKTAWESAQYRSLKKAGYTDSLINKFKSLKNDIEVYDEFEKLSKQGIGVITIEDGDYPMLLKHLYQSISPYVLYYKSSFKSFREIYENVLVGIVGTRNMTEYGDKITQNLVRGLANHKAVIVSGMARGIDSRAHYESIKSGLPTIAVLGFGFNKVPFHMIQTVQEICKNGMIISEYPPDLSAKPAYFPMRNRIISGLSSGVVVVEAGEVSGALITAEMAVNEGREVMAIPGDIYSEKSKGTNKLIKKQQAHLVSSSTEVISILNLEPRSFEDRKYTKIQIKNKEHFKIIDLLKRKPLTQSELLEKTNFSTSEFQKIITELELLGNITKNFNGKYTIETY